MTRSILVTGGFGALGQVVAGLFAARGDRVARVDYADSAPPGGEGMLDIGGVDITDAAVCQSVVDKVTTQFGGLDVLVNIAGGFVWQTLEGGDLAGWQKMHQMNVVTTATMTKAALPALTAAPAGRIINIGAAAAISAASGMGAYAASKAGVHRLTESLAAEVAGTSLTVNALLPTIIDTPANRADMPTADTSGWVKPAAIADVIYFLASPAARAISGALISVSRGGD